MGNDQTRVGDHRLIRGRWVRLLAIGATLLCTATACGGTARAIPGNSRGKSVPRVSQAYDQARLLPPTDVGLAEESRLVGFRVLVPSWLPPGGHLCQVTWMPPVPPGVPPPPPGGPQPPTGAHLMFCGPQTTKWIVVLTERRGQEVLSEPDIRSATVDGLALQEIPQGGTAVPYIDVVVINFANGYSYQGIGAHVPLATLERVMVSILKPTSSQS